jgi:hypothetical protein
MGFRSIRDAFSRSSSLFFYDRRIMRSWQFLSLIILFAAAISAAGQQIISINGYVVDPSGAAVPGATVRIERSGGALVTDTKTDARGSFQFNKVPFGDYSLTVPAYLGLAAKSVPLHLTTNVAGLKVRLATEMVSQTVVVGADRSLSADAAGNLDTVAVTESDLRTAPVFDQNVIATLTPFLDASSGSSGGTTIIVDGVEVNSIPVSASAIQEVRINNDPYSAEFNRPGRGRIEIMTKPGTPDFHGEVNFTGRNAVFNAKNYFAQVRPPESREIYEGHLRGPVGRGGRTNFITSGSLQKRDTAVAVDAIGPGGPIHENVFTPSRGYQATMRVTRDFSPAHRLSVGYNFEYGAETNAGVGGIILPEAGYNSSSREDDAIFNDRIIATENFINQLQLVLEKDEDVTVSTTNAPAIQVSGSFIGGGAQADQARSENTIHISEAASWNHGRHYLRFGVQLPQFSRRAVDDHTNRLGTFQFGSIADYNNNAPFAFTAQQGIGRGLYWINEAGGFIQDQVKLGARLQASFGLRYDWQTFLDDANNFAPRLSLSYAPDKDKTILRAGAGVFYDRTGGDFPSTVVLHNGVVLHSVQLLNPPYPLPSGTNLAAVPTNLARFAPNIRNPYSFQYSFGVERQVHQMVTVTAAYRGSVQVKSFRSVDINAPLLPPNPGLTANYPRPDPSLGQVQQIESGGRALVNALDLSFRGHAGRVFSGQVQYTLSRYMNNTGGIKAFPENQYNPNAEWGRADQDSRQRFNLIGNINPDRWLTLGVAASLYSGTPYSETTGNDDYHTGLNNARPAGMRRNTLQSGGTADLDLLWDHDFCVTRAKGDKAKIVSCGISAFNVLNRVNYSGYIGALSSSLFAQPTTALPGRQLQFAVGYRF